MATSNQLNLTPLLQGRINKLVLNPSWHVPPRIKERELDVLARQDPAIYDTFRLYVDESGRERAVQRPGPHSALGQVKLAFPNDHAIFLHDTPRKDLFAQTDRAISHGCIRVENAIGLAKSLLAREPEALAPSQVDELLRANYETPISLTHGIHVTIEYRTAGTSMDGAFRFFPDVYGWGHARAPEATKH